MGGQVDGQPWVCGSGTLWKIIFPAGWLGNVYLRPASAPPERFLCQAWVTVPVPLSSALTGACVLLEPSDATLAVPHAFSLYALGVLQSGQYIRPLALNLGYPLLHPHVNRLLAG